MTYTFSILDIGEWFNIYLLRGPNTVLLIRAIEASSGVARLFGLLGCLEVVE
jgi:hypothetical protein